MRLPSSTIPLMASVAVAGSAGIEVAKNASFHLRRVRPRMGDFGMGQAGRLDEVCGQVLALGGVADEDPHLLVSR